MKLTLVILSCFLGMSMSYMSPLSNCFLPKFEVFESKSTKPHGTVGGNSKQTSGHAKIRNGVGHMFWWLYRNEAQPNAQKKIPLAIWLHGGPGEASSGYGNFGGIGPLDMELKDREHTWVKHMHMLFVDSPVGAGFSYVDKKESLATSDEQMANDLVELVERFLDMPEHDEFKSTPLHIFGEGYGGKIAVEFAYKLHEKIRSGDIVCKLKSVTTIGGWISPKHSIESWAPFLLQMGRITTDGEKIIAEHAAKISGLLNKALFTKATDMWTTIVGSVGLKTNGINWCSANRKISTKENILNPEFKMHRNDDHKKWRKFMDRVRIDLKLDRVAIREWGYWSEQAFEAAKKDFMQPATKTVKELLENSSIKVNVVSGQFDLTAATSGTANWVDDLEWSHKKIGYMKKIIVRDTCQGYYITQHHLTLYSVWHAGRAIPIQNPEAMITIIQRIINE